MRLNRMVCCLALAVAPALALACENEEKPAASVAQPQQPPGPSVQERARSLLLAADLQLRDLKENRDQITDPNKRDAIAIQIVALSASRNRLMGDLVAGSIDQGVLERDLSNLQRVMSAKGAAEAQPAQPRPQAPQPPPPQQVPQQQPQPQEPQQQQPPY